jgi:hypothetical protein
MSWWRKPARRLILRFRSGSAGTDKHLKILAFVEHEWNLCSGCEKSVKNRKNLPLTPVIDEKGWPGRICASRSGCPSSCAGQKKPRRGGVELRMVEGQSGRVALA